MAAKVRQINGAWWVVTHHQGKRKKQRIGPTQAHKRQAGEITKKINAALALGHYRQEYTEDRALPCDAQLRRWHQTYGPTMKLTSEIAAKGLIENHLIPHLGSRDIREISEENLLAFARIKVESGLAPKTVLNALSVLRRVYYLAQREGLVERNPAACIGELMQRVDRRRSGEVRHAEAWTREEVEQLLKLAREHEPTLYPALLFLFSTGVRRGELLGLKWADVNFDRRRVTIRRAITARQITTPKSGRSRIITPGGGCPPAWLGTTPQLRRAVSSTRAAPACAAAMPATPDPLPKSTTQRPRTNSGLSSR